MCTFPKRYDPIWVEWTLSGHKMSDPYLPVSCALHSALELAALQRRPVILQLHDGRHLQGQILDVWTAAGREWLKLLDQHQEHILDLTFIDQLQESSLHEN